MTSLREACGEFHCALRCVALLALLSGCPAPLEAPAVPLREALVGAPWGVGPATVSTGQAVVADFKTETMGGQTLLVWSDGRAGGSDLFYLRLSGAGVPIGFATRVTASPGYATLGGVVSDGSAWFIAWSRFNTANLTEQRVTRVEADGTSASPLGVLVDSALGSSAPSIAVSDATLLLSWKASNSVVVQRLSTVPALLGTKTVVRNGPSLEVESVGRPGTGFVVAWSDTRSGSGADLYLTPVTQVGTVLFPEGAPVVTGAANTMTPRLAAVGQQLAMAWSDTTAFTTTVARLTAASTAADDGGLSMPSQGGHSLAAWGDDFVLANRDGLGITGWRLPVDGGALRGPTTLLSLGGPYLTSAALAQTDAGDLLMAIDALSPSLAGAELVVSVVRPDGGVMTPPARMLSTLQRQHHPSLAVTPSGYALTWATWSTAPEQSFITRLAGDGLPATTSPVRLASGATGELEPLVCATASSIVTLYDVPTCSGCNARPWFTVFDFDGGVVRSATPVTPGQQGHRSLACGAGVAWLLWADVNNSLLKGQLVSATGVPLGNAVIISPVYSYTASVVFDGTDFVVVWTGQPADGGFGYPLQGARLSPDGGLRDPVGGVPLVPSLAFDPVLSLGPAGMRLAWTVPPDQNVASPSQVRTAWLFNDGGLSLGAVRALSQVSKRSVRPKLSFDTNGEALVLWEDELFQVGMALDGVLLLVDGGVELDAGLRLGGSAAPVREATLAPIAGGWLLASAAYDPSPAVNNFRLAVQRVDFHAPPPPVWRSPLNSSMILALTAPTLSAEPAARVQLTLDGADAGSVIALTDGGARFLSFVLPVGAHTAVAVAIDAVGNTSAPSQVNFTVVSLTDAGSPDAGAVDAGADAGQVDAGEVDAGEVDAGEVDAGEVDAGEVDAGEVDAGEVDAGEVDAGEVDAGEVDAGEVDAGEVDAGEVDAGEVDAGEVDAGDLDAGTPDSGAADSGFADAGPGAFDGGSLEAADGSVMREPQRYPIGCECGAAGGGSALFWLGGLLVATRRRRVQQ